MGRVAWAIVPLLLLVSLAGCADNGGKKTDSAIPIPDSIENVQVTDDTGAIRGIVVDQKVAPIKDVKVSLRGGNGEAQTTAADGGFVFNGLEAGDYFLTAEKPGYQAIQSSATVVAGLADPPVTRIIMTIDNVTAPFVELTNWKAFLQCGIFLVAVSTNPCALTGSDNVHDFGFGAGTIPDFAQTEAVWKGTQPLGNYLSMGYFLSGISNWKSSNGVSPLVVKATQDEIIKAKGEDIDRLTVRIFPGTDPSGVNPTVVLNQQYDIYTQYFYNFVPRDDYMFANDGPCDPVTVCQ